MKLEVLEYLPETEANVPPLLFVHGAFHGAWCWEEHFLPYFASQGFRSYAVSLRGHGASEGYDKLHSFTLSDYVHDVLEVLPRTAGKPILIGHSMGGGVVQKILHMHPDRFSGAVLLAAVPPQGGYGDLWRLMRRHFRASLKMFSYNKKKNAAFLADVFFSPSLPADKRDQFVSLLQPESSKARQEMTKPLVPKEYRPPVPVLVVGSTGDSMVSEKTIGQLGAQYGTKPVLFDGVSHDMMLDPQWESVAEQVLAFLQEVSVSEERR